MRLNRLFDMDRKKMNLFSIPEITVTYQSNVRAVDRPDCSNSTQAFQLLWEWWEPGTIELYETFAVLLLDRAKRAMGIFKASQGGYTGTVADARMIFAPVLKARADAIVLAHNHPSGLLRPSAADVQLTTKLVEAGKLLDTHIVDHLILTPDERYYSFNDNDLMDHRGGYV